LTDPKSEENLRLMWILGAVLTVPMILASGPIAGYVISRYVLVRFFALPGITIPILIALGFLASGLQGFEIIKKIQKLDKK
jgi:hypothetical protein